MMAAKELDCPKSSLASRLSRGRELLRQSLTKRGIALSTAALTTALAEKSTGTAVGAMLAIKTAKAAASMAAGKTVAETILSAHALALAEEVMKGMFAINVKVTVAAVVLGLAVGGAGLAGYGSLAHKQRSPEPESAQLPTPKSDPRGTAKNDTPAPVDQFGDPLPAGAIARLGTIRFHHGASPQAIVFAPDGKSLASAGTDGTVHIWESATGKELLRIDNVAFGDSIGLGHVMSLDFAPDGKTLAGARLNQPPCLWDVKTGKELRQFGGNRRASWVTFSPDGKTLAHGGGHDDAEGIWLSEVDSGQELQELKGSKGRVTGAVFSPDGKSLATVDKEVIRLFDLMTGQGRVLHQEPAESTAYNQLVFSPDGNTLAVSNEHKLIRLVLLPSGKTAWTVRMEGNREPPRVIVFTPEGKLLVSGHDDGFVRFWDATSGAKVREFRAFGGSITALALSPDGQTLAASTNSHIDGDHSVRLWETATGKPLVRHAGPQAGIATVVFSPDSAMVATSSWEGAIHLWEASTGKLLHHLEGFGPLAFTPDSLSLIFGGWSDGKVHFLDLASQKESKQFAASEKGIRSLSLSRDGRKLATLGSEVCKIWDLTTDKLLQDFGGMQSKDIYSFALSPDGKLLGTGYEHQGVRLWDTATGKLFREHAQPFGEVARVAFSGDGKLLASTHWADGGSVKYLQLWEVATGTALRKLAGASDPMGAVAFSPDGRTLMWSGGQHERSWYLWEVETGQLRRKFVGHQGRVACVAYSPNGRMLASGSADGSVLIWDNTGQLEREKKLIIPLGAAQLEKLWGDLADQSAAISYQGICALRASPSQAVPFLDKHLKPVAVADAKQIAIALRDLGSEQFKVRSQANHALEMMAEAAEPAMREALASMPSEEARQRIKLLLDRLGGTEQLRGSRALEVLEQIGDSASRRLLTKLAQGAPQARFTREAEEALKRSGAR
jgi:WD40 repeat protein